MATESYVQVAPNSTGAKIRNVEVVVDVPGSPDTSTVEQQVTSLADGDGVLLGPLTQGSDGTTATGLMVQGLVNDTPNSYEVGVLQPLSLTAEGRLRVSAVPADVGRVWQETFESPWFEDDPWAMENPYV